MKRAKLKRIFSGLGVILIVLVLGYIVIRPLHLRWGASAKEISSTMPGDLNGVRWTRAITIEATPEQIWPWLVQWGQGRGGWYSYDWLENLLGFDIHTAKRILPEYQTVALGDEMCMAANFCPMNVTEIEPNRWLVWQAKDEKGEKPVWTFILNLVPINETQTRLIVRESFDKDWLPPAAAIGLEIPDVVMEEKALNTVKNRAEGVTESGLTTPYEITVWLAALLIGLIAGVLFVQRDGKRFLALGGISVMILLVLTFLFPPLWLRGVLDLGLLAALIGSIRRAD